ncbi:hypothetical protein L2K20_10020 [Mycobacterium sp. MBM]|nr:hypothetical protein [Mycobacterium sp. MBM]
MSGTPPYLWTEYAERSHPSWSGTLVSEFKTSAGKALYDYAGVDIDEWLIIGVEVASFNPSVPDTERKGIATAIAVPRSEVPEGGDFHDLAEIDAVHIKLHGVDGLELLRLLIGDVNIRVRRHDLKNTDIRVVELGDSPTQD